MSDRSDFSDVAVSRVGTKVPPGVMAAERIPYLATMTVWRNAGFATEVALEIIEMLELDK